MYISIPAQLQSGTQILTTPDGKLIQKNENETASEMSSMSRYLFQNSHSDESN